MILFTTISRTIYLTSGFPGGSVVKSLPAKAGDIRDASSIPGSGRSPGEKNGYPLQYSCLENSMNRGAWRATVHRGHKESDTTERLTLNTLPTDLSGKPNKNST